MCLVQKYLLAHLLVHVQWSPLVVQTTEEIRRVLSPIARPVQHQLKRNWMNTSDVFRSGM